MTATGDDQPPAPASSPMGDEERDALYTELVRLCQERGITTATTYELLHSAVGSIAVDVDAPRERTFLSLRWSDADLRTAWAATQERDDDPDGAAMPPEVLAGMLACARRIEDRIAELGSEVIDTYLTAGLWRA